ncbi:hypothetical protein Gpo141_00001963 [Globisporangium polare]
MEPTAVSRRKPRTKPEAVATAEGRGSDDCAVALLLAETDELLSTIDPTVYQLQSVERDSVSLQDASRYAAVAASGDSQSTALTKRPRSAPKPGARRNPSRERMQQELAYLRAQVAELDQLLQKERSTTKWGDAGMLTLLGRRTVKRQKELCDRAQVENKRLRVHVEAQHLFAMEMQQRLYCNWQQTMVAAADPRKSLVPFTSVTLEPSDGVALETLLTELEDAFEKTEQVFQAPSFKKKEPVSGASERKQRMPDGSLRSYVEFASITISPFAFEVNQKVAWACVKKHNLSRANSIRVPLSESLERDTFAVKYRARQNQGGVDASFDSLFAMRRYERHDKEFWIWRGVSVSEQYTKDIHVDETGWLEMSALVVEAPKICSVSNSLVGTVMKSSVQYETKRLSNTPNCAAWKPDASVITALVLSSFEGDLAEMGEMMETMVLEESLRQKAPRGARGPAADYSLCL